MINKVENKYGNLLNNIEKDYTQALVINKKRAENQMRDRYGNLMDEVVSPLDSFYDNVFKVNEENRKYREEEEKASKERQIRIAASLKQDELDFKERQESYLQLINDMEKQKLTEAKKLEEQRKREDNHNKLLSKIESMMEISPQMAVALAKTSRK